MKIAIVSHGTIWRRTTHSNDPTSVSSTRPPSARDRLVMAWNPSVTVGSFVTLTCVFPLVNHCTEPGGPFA